MNWKQFEDDVYSELCSRYPNTSIIRNAKILGRVSLRSRQIDVLIEEQILDTPVRIIVDAKQRTSPIDVNDVESFIGMMHDVGAHRGMLVASSGYTKAATMRAHRELQHDIELEVFSLEELRAYQSEMAIPFSGGFAAFVRAPFGWVVDGTRREGAVACVYQRGYDLNAAQATNEWAYVNFWKKDSEAMNLTSLLNNQSAALTGAKITLLPGVTRPDANTQIRVAEVPGYPTPEYTGFVEFEKFIFFIVLFTGKEAEKRNLRKLREVLRTVLQVKQRDWKQPWN